MKTTTTELKPIYDRAKSFYRKANIIVNNNIIILKSYETEILKYNTKTQKLVFLTKWEYHFTQTTNRHINEFLHQFTNITPKSKKELLAMSKNGGI